MPRFAYDSYRRFITMYCERRARRRPPPFRGSLQHHKDLKGYDLDTDLTADDWKKLIPAYKAIVEDKTGKPFPQDTQEQLWGAIGAVFGSWQNDRAITYRRLYDIPDDWGTAVNVQAMVFGNLGETERDRRRLHAQSLDRREGHLRRVPGQCAGRGRRRRHPHAAAADRTGRAATRSSRRPRSRR